MPCRVSGTLAEGPGRRVRVYSRLAHADVDATISEDGASFSAELPERGGLVITAVATDGRTVEQEASCAEDGFVSVAMKFPPPRKTFAAIDGRCVYLETGAGVDGARVYADGWSTLADEAGKFRVHAAGGSFRVRCAKDGDESEVVRVEASSGEKRSIEIRLAASTAVLGRVLDRRGEPVEWAQVSIRDRRRELRSVYTDASGSFELRGIAPGSVIVAAQSEVGFAEKQLIARLGLPYAEVELILGTGTRTVRGRVVDDQDVPVEDARVRADGPLDREVRTDGVGRFAIAGLAAEPIELKVDAEGFVAWARELDPDAFAKPVEVKLERGCNAEVRVVPDSPKTQVVVRIGEVRATGETGEVIRLKGVRGEQTISAESIGATAQRGSVTATVCPTQQPIIVTLGASEGGGAVHVVVERKNKTPVENMEINLGRRGLRARTDARGEATFENVPLGEQTVWIESDREQVTVNAGQTAEVRFTVRDDEGEVTGYVTAQNRPLEGAAIRASCGSTGYARSLFDAELVARTNAAGAFAFDPENATVCTVRAEHADEGASDAVVLRVGGLPAELEINRLASISGVVLERDSNAPVTAYQLSVRPIGRASDVDARSLFIDDPSGRFQLDGLQPGLLSISVRADRGQGHMELEVERGASIDGLELYVIERGAVSGRVVADRAPVPNARVTLKRARDGVKEGETQTGPDGRFELASPGGDALRVAVAREGYYPQGTPPFDLDPFTGKRDVGDVTLQPRGGREEKEGGIGIQFGNDAHGVRVVEFVADSPAREAGLEIGDVISKIDGTPAGRLPLMSWLLALRGPVGTPVVLEVERGTLPRFSVTVIRRAIGLPALPDEDP